jgi:hypothetical protein
LARRHGSVGGARRNLLRTPIAHAPAKKIREAVHFGAGPWILKSAARTMVPGNRRNWKRI